MYIVGGLLDKVRVVLGKFCGSKSNGNQEERECVGGFRFFEKNALEDQRLEIRFN